jgi:hypothetical protein
MTWFVRLIYPLIGLVLGLTISAYIRIAEVKNEVSILAKIMNDTNARCACVPKEAK